MAKLLNQLITRGDRISVENGELRIYPASGLEVPRDWYQEVYSQLISELAEVLHRPVLLYEGRQVKEFNGGKWPGLWIDLRCLKTRKIFYSIFNVKIQRSRNTKFGGRGAKVTKGKFIVGKRSALVQLWEELALKMPPRLASFHDYIGNLKYRLFTYQESHEGKIKSTGLLPLRVTYSEITAALRGFTDNSLTNDAQLPHNCRTSIPYKESREAQRISGFREDFTTRASNYEISNLEEGDKCLNMDVCSVPLSDQSVEDWLADYDGPPH